MVRNDKGNSGCHGFGRRQVEALAACGQHHCVGVSIEFVQSDIVQFVVDGDDLGNIRIVLNKLLDLLWHIIVWTTKSLDDEAHWIIFAEGSGVCGQ